MKTKKLIICHGALSYYIGVANTINGFPFPKTRNIILESMNKVLFATPEALEPPNNSIDKFLCDKIMELEKEIRNKLNDI